MKKVLFDSHAHLNNNPYKEKAIEDLARQIENSALEYVIDIGFDLESSARAIKHSDKYPWCYATVGFHPHDAKNMTDEDLLFIENLAKKPKCVAIGEIGLDYYRNLSPKEDQEECFRKQIRLAIKLKKPITIHDRDANSDVLRILKEEGVFSKERKSDFSLRKGEGDARLLMHCYSGSAELARQYVKLGATLSIAGPLTYKNARKPQEVVREIPLDYLLIETDSPYLTPEPLRGKKNTPMNVEFVARKMAELKGLTYEEVAEVTNNNAKRFYGIS